MTDFGLETRPMGTLTDRLRDFLEESTEEVAALQRKREELEEERSERIVSIRAEYAEKIAAVDDELDAVRRLERALEPKAARKAPGPKPKGPTAGPGVAKPKGFRPTPGKLRAVLEVMHEKGADVSSLITPHVDFSDATVRYAMDALRADGLIRLTGERIVNPNGSVPARTFAVTPEGEHFLEANLSANGTPA